MRTCRSAHTAASRWRHAFPLDGEYTFKLRLQRNSIGDTIRGIDDEHEIQVRIDHRLVERFSVGGQYPGHDIGLVNGIRDDDLEARALHTYRLTADDHLELRIPVTAGTRLVTAAFTDSAPAVSEPGAVATVGVSATDLLGRCGSSQHRDALDRRTV